MESAEAAEERGVEEECPNKTRRFFHICSVVSKNPLLEQHKTSFFFFPSSIFPKKMHFTFCFPSPSPPSGIYHNKRKQKRERTRGEEGNPRKRKKYKKINEKVASPGIEPGSERKLFY